MCTDSVASRHDEDIKSSAKVDEVEGYIYIQIWKTEVLMDSCQFLKEL